MPWFTKIILGIEALIFAYFLVALVVKLVQRLKEYKKDKYKDIKY